MWWFRSSVDGSPGAMSERPYVVVWLIGGTGHRVAMSERPYVVVWLIAARSVETRPAVMVVETGVDPVTPRFSGVCSAN